MNELLKALYDNFYEKLPAAEIKAEIDESIEPTKNWRSLLLVWLIQKLLLMRK